MSKVVNIVLQQSGWFACVLGAAWGRPWLGAAIALLLVAIHVALVKERGPELRLILAAGLLGTVLDSIQGRLGVVQFQAGYYVGWLCPLWITVLWMQFATLLHFAADWMAKRYLLATVLGAVGGPVAFYGGVRLGAATLHPNLPFALAALALEWAVAMPLLVWLGDRFPVTSGYRGLPGKNALVRRM